MKLYIEAKPYPWVTWDKDLWTAAQKTSIKNFEITSIEKDADITMVEYYHGLDYRFTTDQKYVVYIESIEYKHIDEFMIKWLPIKNAIKIISDSIDVIQTFKEKGWTVYRWNKPSRVPVSSIYSSPLEIAKKTGGFTITSRCDRAADNMSEILRTYFSMCLTDDPENEGELLCMEDVNIFSAQELPFETFNNIYFNGLQPNPKMFKAIKASKLFISPYNGDGVPINAIDAVMLGTPVIVRNSEVNRSVFNWDNKCFYSSEKDLAQKIKYFSEISIDDLEYIDIIERGFSAISKTHSVNVSLFELIYILQG